MILEALQWFKLMWYFGLSDVMWALKIGSSVSWTGLLSCFTFSSFNSMDVGGCGGRLVPKYSLWDISWPFWLLFGLGHHLASSIKGLIPTLAILFLEKKSLYLLRETVLLCGPLPPLLYFTNSALAHSCVCPHSKRCAMGEDVRACS